MKKFLFVIVCFLGVSLAVSAQPGGNRNRTPQSPEDNAKRLTEMLKTKLNLTSDQIAPVDSVNLVIAKAQAKLRENANGDRSSMREEFQKLEGQRVEAFGKILTDEQQQVYKKFMEERRNNRANRGGERRN